MEFPHRGDQESIAVSSTPCPCVAGKAMLPLRPYGPHLQSLETFSAPTVHDPII